VIEVCTMSSVLKKLARGGSIELFALECCSR